MLLLSMHSFLTGSDNRRRRFVRPLDHPHSTARLTGGLISAVRLTAGLILAARLTAGLILAARLTTALISAARLTAGRGALGRQKTDGSKPGA